MISRRLGVPLALALVLGTQRAHAQPQRAPGETDAVDSQLRDAARMHFEEGVRHASQGRWGVAILEFEQARDLRPTPAVFFNLGMAYREDGRIADAINALETFVASRGAAAETARISIAVATLNALRNHAGRLTLNLVPSEARASLNGRPLATARETFVDPGPYTLRVEANGFESNTQPVEIIAGRSVALSVRLTPLAPLVTPRPTAHPAARPRARSVLASPWLWVGASALVAAGVVVAVLLALPSEPTPIDGALGHVSNAVISW